MIGAVIGAVGAVVGAVRALCIALEVVLANLDPLFTPVTGGY